MRLRAWIGHYQDNPREWFLIFGRDEDEAINFVDCEWGEPDPRSMIEIPHPMGMNFRASIVEEEGLRYVEIEAHPGKVSLGDGGGYRTLSEWVEERLTMPLGPPEEPELSEVGRMMGISNARVMRTYLKDNPSLAPKPIPKLKKAPPKPRKKDAKKASSTKKRRRGD